MRFFNASVLPRKALNRNLSWGFPLGNLLPKTRVLKHRVLERKRRPNLGVLQRPLTLILPQKYRDSVYTTFCQEEGILWQKYAIEMGGVSRYF